MAAAREPGDLGARLLGDRDGRLRGSSSSLLPKVLPFSLKKEIQEDQNTALGIVIAAIVLGMAFIIGQAIG